MKYFKKLYAVPPMAGMAIEKKQFFVCPKCGRAICSKIELPLCKANYCIYCRAEIESERKKAQELLKKEKQKNGKIKWY